MNEPLTGLGKVYRFLERWFRLFWVQAKVTRPIVWHSNALALMYFMGAYTIADAIEDIFYKNEPWYFKDPIFVGLFFLANTLTPDSKRIRDVGYKIPASLLVAKTFLGLLILILSDVVQFTLDTKHESQSEIIAAAISTILALVGCGTLPMAIRDVREDVIQEVLDS